MVLKEGIQKKKEIKGRIVRDEVKKQVDNVKLIIQDLLRRKVAELRAQNPEGKQREEEQSADQGQLYTYVAQAIDNLKTELVNAPSTETVRQVRIMLNDIVKKFKGMPTSSIKAILDLMFNFIPFIKIKKDPTGAIHDDDSNYNNATGKQAEVRRLIRDLLLKFVHENAIRYLGADIYPKTYEEAVKYFNIEEKGTKLVDEETADAESRNNIPRNASIRNQAIQNVVKYFIDNPNALTEWFQSRASAQSVLRKVGAEDIYNDKFEKKVYDDALEKHVNKALERTNGFSAAESVARALLIDASDSQEKQIKKILSKKKPVFKTLVDILKPTTFKELINIIKVATNQEFSEHLLDKLDE